MKYGIDYRNYSTGIHGILIFEDEQQAEEALDTLTNAPQDETLDEHDRDVIMASVFENAHANLEEYNYRDLKPVMENIKYPVASGRRVSIETDDIQIINLTKLVEI